MKRTKFLIVLALLGVSVSFWQCGSDPAPATKPKDEQLLKLSKSWTATATGVSIDGQPQTGYTSFKIVMTSTPGQETFDYTTTGRPALSAWPSAGKFTFETEFNTLVKRDDGVIVTYTVSATSLRMDFTYTCATCNGFSRVGNVKGAWSFEFSTP